VAVSFVHSKKLKYTLTSIDKLFLIKKKDTTEHIWSLGGGRKNCIFMRYDPIVMKIKDAYCCFQFL
jgi:hypothetical protein